MACLYRKWSHIWSRYARAPVVQILNRLGLGITFAEQPPDALPAQDRIAALYTALGEGLERLSRLPGDSELQLSTEVLWNELRTLQEEEAALIKEHYRRSLKLPLGQAKDVLDEAEQLKKKVCKSFRDRLNRRRLRLNADTIRKRSPASVVIERTARVLGGSLASHVHFAFCTKPISHERWRKELARRRSSTLCPRASLRVKPTRTPTAFYICRFCNEARSNLAVTQNGRQLLKPTEDAWAEHFEVDEFEMRSLDGDATYTEQAYDINDRRKIVLRRERARVYDDHIPLIDHADGIMKLHDLAKQQSSIDAQRSILAAAERQRNATQHALTDLQGYSVIPPDAPDACKCGDVELKLPDAIGSQEMSLPSPPTVVASGE